MTTSTTSGPARLSISLTDWALLLALSLLWGGSFVLAKLAVFEVPPVTLSFVRITIAAVLLWLVVRARGLTMPRDAATWRAFMPLSLFNNVFPFTLMYWAQLHIPAGLGAILNATTPFFAVVLAALFIDGERLSAARLTGLIAGFAGVVVMIGPELLGQIGVDLLAQGAALVAALCFSLAALTGRRLRGIPPLTVATGQLIISAVLMAPASLLFDRPWTLPVPSWMALWTILALAVFSTALAYLLFFTILARIGATNALLVTFIQPLWAVLLGAIVFSERLTPLQFAGMAGILIGLAVIDGRVLSVIPGRSRHR